MILGATKTFALSISKKSSTTLNTNNAWYRVAQIDYVNTQSAGSYFVHISSDYRHRVPSPMLFQLAHSYNTHYFAQIGKRPTISTSPDYSAVRVIQKDHSLFIDVKASVGPTGGNYGQVDIISLNNIISNITIINFTDVTLEDPGSNYTEITPVFNN